MICSDCGIAFLLYVDGASVGWLNSVVVLGFGVFRHVVSRHVLVILFLWSLNTEHLN